MPYHHAPINTSINPQHQTLRTIPGLDADAIPLLGMGLGLTGLVLGLRPRLLPLPLALTALVALLYRDPQRTTPNDPDALFAAADGTVFTIDEVYEHRYLHTDALRIATVLSPLDMAVNRSPVSGTIRYLEHIPGAYASPRTHEASRTNTRTYIGIETSWGPLMLVQVAGPLARRIVCYVQEGDYVAAGQRLGNVRFAARTDIIVQRDSLEMLVAPGQHLTAGVTRLARVIPLSQW